MIDYIVFPVADIDEEKSAKIDELNLVPRSNVSKDKVLMKCQHYKEVFPEKVTRTVTTDEEGLEIISIEYPYETYSNEALATLLSSPQQTAKVSVWDLIDAEIEPLTNEQRNMLATNEEYVANYNNLQSMVQAEVLNLVRANIENSPEGKALLDNQLKLVKNLKTSIIEMSQREMQLFNAFKEASAKNPSLTYDEFIKTMK